MWKKANARSSLGPPESESPGGLPYPSFYPVLQVIILHTFEDGYLQGLDHSLTSVGDGVSLVT